METIEQLFIKKVCESFSLLYLNGVDMFQVSTPFRLANGDHITVYLVKKDNKWMVSDSAYFHYELMTKITSFKLEKYEKIHSVIRRIFEEFQVDAVETELIIYVTDDAYENAIFKLCQVLLMTDNLCVYARLL